MRDVVIASGVRTAGSFGGILKDTSAVDLGGIVIKEALRRAKVTPDKVDLVIMGNVLQAGHGQNPARQATIYAGIPKETPAFTLNKLCASGLKSIALGAQSVQAGEADVVVAGGMENMSRGVSESWLSRRRLARAIRH